MKIDAPLSVLHGLFRLLGSFERGFESEGAVEAAWRSTSAARPTLPTAFTLH